MVSRRIAIVSLFCGATPHSITAYAQINLDFEALVPHAVVTDAASVPGWQVQGGGTTIELDSGTHRGGARSVRVVSRQARGRSRFSQELDVREIRGDRVRISAYVKTSDGATGAALRVRVDGDDGFIYIDRTDAANTSSADAWRRLTIDAPLAPTARALSFGGELVGQGEAWFDDFEVELIDTDSLPAPSPAASRYVEYALSVVEEHAIVGPQLDWSAYRAAVMRQARGSVSEADAYLALRHALGILGDRHSYFMTAGQVATLASSPVENARTRRPVIAPQAEAIAGSIGYFRLPGFAGGTHMDRVEFAERVQAQIAELDTMAACGWIIDLRDNSGGNLWPMIAGLGPLLGNGDVGASVWPDGTRRRFWYEDGKAGLDDYVQLRVRGVAYRLRRAGAPIAVVIDGRTASAAEILAVAFAARPRTRSFGETTRGATTATRTFPLSDGAALVLAVASTSDRNGRIYTGAIRPDEAVSAAERGVPLSEQPAIRAARRWLDTVGEGASALECGTARGA